MTDRSETDASGDISGAPIDFDRLDIIEERVATDERFSRIENAPEFAPDRLVCVYDQRFYTELRGEYPAPLWAGMKPTTRDTNH